MKPMSPPPTGLLEDLDVRVGDKDAVAGNGVGAEDTSLLEAFNSGAGGLTRRILFEGTNHELNNPKKKLQSKK